MRTVWILNHYAQEPGGPGGTRHYSLAKHLAQHGWEGVIIAASVEYNTGRQRLARRESFRLEQFDRVPFLWLRTPQHEGNGPGRILNMLAYTAKSLIPRCTSVLARPNVIVGSSVHPFAAWAGMKLAARHRVPFIFEVRDLWPQTLVDMGRLSPRGLVTGLLRSLEKKLYDRAERIIVLLPGAAEYIVPLGINRAKIVWIPNGVDLSDCPAPFPAPVHDTFTFMYFGAHGTANGLDNIIRAMKCLKDRRLRQSATLRLVGDGPDKPRLMALARELRVDNVFFENPVPKKRISSLAAEADAFVFNLVDAPVFKYGVSSNKLYDFMAAGRPVVFCCRSGNNPVEKAECGVTVGPGDPQALADAMDRVVDMPAERRWRMGLAGRRYVEDNHALDKLTATLAEILDAACKTEGQA